jgi:hypothetical protein
MRHIDRDRINGPRPSVEDQVKTAWQRFVETFEPLRPDLYHSLLSPISHAVDAEFRRGDRDGVARAERQTYRDEPVVITWYEHDDCPAVRDVVRLTAEGDRVATIHFYFFCPDVVGEICSELGLPWRSNGYRYWAAE